MKACFTEIQLAQLFCAVTAKNFKISRKNLINYVRVHSPEYLKAARVSIEQQKKLEADENPMA